LWQAPNFLDLSQLPRLVRVAHACWSESRKAHGRQGVQGLPNLLGLIALHVRLISDTDRRLSSFLASDFVLENFGCGADSLWSFTEAVLHTATDAELLSEVLKVLRSGTRLMDSERCADALETLLACMDFEALLHTRSSAKFEVIATLVDALEASRAFAKLFITQYRLTPRAQVAHFLTFASTRSIRVVCGCCWL
jgi:hypothetical protein